MVSDGGREAGKKNMSDGFLRCNWLVRTMLALRVHLFSKFTCQKSLMNKSIFWQQASSPREPTACNCSKDKHHIPHLRAWNKSVLYSIWMRWDCVKYPLAHKLVVHYHLLSFSLSELNLAFMNGMCGKRTIQRSWDVFSVEHQKFRCHCEALFTSEFLVIKVCLWVYNDILVKLLLQWLKDLLCPCFLVESYQLFSVIQVYFICSV